MKELVLRIVAKIMPAVLKAYCCLYVPVKVWQVRHKKKIRVLFVIQSLSLWKTELLYVAMLRHKRFEPCIGIVTSMEEDDAENIKSYLDEKSYGYEMFSRDENFWRKSHADIILYQKPYENMYSKWNGYKRNLYALFCYVNYAFHSVDEEWAFNAVLRNIAWQVYFENNSAMDVPCRMMTNKCRNGLVTGLPMMDELLIEKERLHDPWKPQTGRKKRIIWAPHHSINQENWLCYSTFLEYADFMLDMAKKYKDKVQFVFKPHSLLREKLNNVWGEDKTTVYYRQWEMMENTQAEYGKYIALFKYSDAMIHDCGSFTIEYHYTQNPVMYLVGDDPRKHEANLNDFAKQAFRLHYWAKNRREIEDFICNVIAEIDTKKEERVKFYNESLLPPGGKTACENIIDAILGND
ncbi:MAG: CDP-glycerol glycerophosphotransferase family protein [Bacteroides sp.]|nr:CDP-glycerol glycerophosphotransferase family protein [Roseburia sp.]MCM1346018.1 CDP-glycerol glycerophosphotransferase family protein [Bacteroides sp.]MCM1421484.1 CDP-glycerol glycerophosphotransferase family protein [Bacteroides sp.]